jgi:phosphohistidine swiveling domain-containing protein
MPSPAELPDGLREIAYINAPRIRRDPEFRSDLTRLVSLLREKELEGRTRRTIDDEHASVPAPGHDDSANRSNAVSRRKSLGDAIARGIAGAPGVAEGPMYTSLDEAIKSGTRGQRAILIMREASPETIRGMMAAVGIITTRGGLISHAAVMARALGIPAVVGVEEIQLTSDGFKVGELFIANGRRGIVDGTVGFVFAAAGPAAGWYRDPLRRFNERYWNGLSWTASVRTMQSAFRSTNVDELGKDLLERDRGPDLS